jgi:hypothetical protein
MSSDREYVVPRYRAGEGEAWFHFLHGNVPGHQIDFMYRPEVPQGALGRSHYSHLTRLMRYIEPLDGSAYAFTVGNLSRDDTQHEPGHGGVALIFGLRIRGATDHAGRPDPPFAHGIAAIDRALDAPMLLEAAMASHGRVLGGAASAEWYRSYVHATSAAPVELERVLAGYVAGFDDLPRPEPSAMSLTWTTGGVTQPERVVFAYPDDAPFEVLAGAATRIAAVLYRSDVRWSAISNGREADLPNGTTVRFLPESVVRRGDAATTVRAIDEIPEDEDAIARELFGAMPAQLARPVVGGWRDRNAVGDSAPASWKQEIPITIEDPAPAPEVREEDAQEPAVAPASEERAGDGGTATAGGITTEVAAGGPSPEIETTLIEAPIAAPEPPAAMLPAPLPPAEPLEPAPPSEPTPNFGRSRMKAIAVAGAFVAGVVAVILNIPKDPHQDQSPVPSVVASAPSPPPTDTATTAAPSTVARVPSRAGGTVPQASATVKARSGAPPRPVCDIFGAPCWDAGTRRR